MTDLIFKSDMDVALVDSHGDDASIVHAARVSVVQDTLPWKQSFLDVAENRGLINYLMKHRHGTPFEHNSVTLRVSAPIFVFREWHRHRIWSFNEQSGRYSKLEPVFHVPGPERPLVNVGTSARPKMAPGPVEQYERQVDRMKRSYAASYASYEEALEDGIAKEVAREVLPVAIYSTMYATTNLRGLLAFLSLRTHNLKATYVSYPQYEIEQAARRIESIAKGMFPLALEAFVANGRVAP